MALNDFFKKKPVKVPYKSAFDKSFRSTLTGDTGTLVPVLCDELIPNTDVYCRVPFVIGLPPLASDTFMNVNYKMEAFFVPTRLLMRGYERAMNGDTKIENTNYNIRFPVVRVFENPAPGTLADYLGLTITDYDYDKELLLSAFPFLAYALIYDEWYRSSLVTKSLFEDAILSNNTYRASHMKSLVPNDAPSGPGSGYQTLLFGDNAFADGSSLNTLRQRNYGMDYFTAATPSAQNGPAIGVNLTLDSDSVRAMLNNGASQWPLKDDEDAIVTGIASNQDPPEFFNNIDESSARNIIKNSGKGYVTYSQGPSKDDLNFNNTTLNSNNPGGAGNPHLGGFTIASLRAANSLQQFLERNNISGNRFVDFLRANYGADLSDGVAQRPIYLGSSSTPVIVSGVMQTANGGQEGSANPFETVGSNYGYARAEGKDFVVKFHVDEPGYFFIIGSLVPEASYSSGIDRLLRRYVSQGSRTDMPNHLLQNVGPQPVLYMENCSVLNSDLDKVFGFVDRYADFMTKKNQVHGLVREGESLASFVFQRSFETSEGINTDFLEIPKNALDGVLAVSNEQAGFSYWADFYFDYKISMPLAKYSIPSLQDPAYEHGETIWLHRGGVRIN